MISMCYLAMTAAEFAACEPMPARKAWMACHFSPYSLGLSNCPQELPADAMLIINDRTPIHGHDPKVILAQLQAMQFEALLLDFQRPGVPETAALVQFLTAELPCPVGVSDLYGQDLNCPIFLPPVPLDMPLDAYLSPWGNREIWLEAALDGMVCTVTENGAAAVPLALGEHPSGGQNDAALHCHYMTELTDTQVIFTLYRNKDDLSALLQAAQGQGVARSIGLYQELR